MRLKVTKTLLAECADDALPVAVRLARPSSALAALLAAIDDEQPGPIVDAIEGFVHAIQTVPAGPSKFERRALLGRARVFHE